MFQTTWIFFDILPRKVFFFRSELGWSATPGLIIETRNTTLFPFLDPCSNRVSINLIYLRDFFDPHPLCAEQNPVRPDPGSGYRIMFHDFCQSVTLVFCQRTHVSHDHHPRGPCCSRARISYDEPCMGAISYQKIFASALTVPFDPGLGVAGPYHATALLRVAFDARAALTHPKDAAAGRQGFPKHPIAVRRIVPEHARDRLACRGVRRSRVSGHFYIEY